MKQIVFVSLLLCASGTVSWAAPPSTVAVFAAGECDNYQLTQAATGFAEALKSQPGLTVVEPGDAAAKLGRETARSVPEVQRQVTLAEDHFYRGQYAKLAEQLDAAFEEISKLAPGRPRWLIYASAWTLEALARSRLKKRGSLEDAYAHILRIDPTYKLDPDYVAPSMIEVFESTRKALAKGPKYKVSIVTPQATGATVYVDGKDFSAKTPATFELPAGRYTISVSRESLYSFPREVDVAGQTEVKIDLGFEGRVSVGPVVCISGLKNESERLESAGRLQSLLDAQQAVVLRLDQSPGQPTWIVATAANGAYKVREGSVEINNKSELSQQDLSDLATFIVTGKPPPGVKAIEEPKEKAPVAVSPGAEKSKDTEPEPEVTKVDPQPAVAGETSQAAPSWKRTAGLAAGGAGAVSAATGAILLILAGNAQAEADRLSQDGILPTEKTRVRDLLDTAATERTIGYVALGVGAAALGAGAFLYLTAPEEGATSVAVIPGPGGVAVFVRGSLPW